MVGLSGGCFGERGEGYAAGAAAIKRRARTSPRKKNNGVPTLNRAGGKTNKNKFGDWRTFGRASTVRLSTALAGVRRCDELMHPMALWASLPRLLFGRGGARDASERWLKDEKMKPRDGPLCFSSPGRARLLFARFQPACHLTGQIAFSGENASSFVVVPHNAHTPHLHTHGRK